MVTRQNALLKYALDFDIDVVTMFWQQCEEIANHITTLITLMERHGFEDGNINIPPVSEDFGERIARNSEDFSKIIKQAGSCFVSAQHLKKLGLLKEYARIIYDDQELNEVDLRQITHALRGRELIIAYHTRIYMLTNAHTRLEDSCFPLTWKYLTDMYLDYTEFLFLKIKRPEPDLVSTSTAWREARQILWDISKVLDYRAQVGIKRLVRKGSEPQVKQPQTVEIAEYAQWLSTQDVDIDELAAFDRVAQEHDRPANETRRSQRGQPRDRPTAELIIWAEAQGITICELAGMLVEEDLDRKRQGSKAARIRTERQRLAQSQRNKENTREAKKFSAVGIESPSKG